MQINTSILAVAETGEIDNVFLYLYKNDTLHLSSHVNPRDRTDNNNELLSLNSVIKVDKGDILEVKVKIQGTGLLRNSSHTCYFSGHMISSITGGGSTPTPEALVWEDKLAERESGTEYTNTNNVPLYVQVYTEATTDGYNLVFYIDGKNMGSVGSGPDGGRLYNTNLYIVPSGSTYKMNNVGGTPSVIKQWHEARMPIAVGTGGKTVAFKAIKTTDIAIADNVDTIVKFDEVKIDTGNLAQSFTGTERGFVITKETEGLWHVDGSVVYKGTESANITRALCNIYVNDKSYTYAQNTEQTGSVSASALLDLKEGDVVTLHARQISGSNQVLQGSVTGEMCYMNAYKISGGSASGDSIWTEEDGKLFIMVKDVNLTTPTTNIGYCK